MGIFRGLAFALIFAGMARYEHLSPWKWGLAAFAISVAVTKLFPLSFIFVLPAEFGLFLVLWWANERRKAELEVSRAEARVADQERRRERLSRAAVEAQADPAREKREAAHDAAEEAARQERIERVRKAREQREREEREQQKGTGGAPTA